MAHRNDTRLQLFLLLATTATLAATPTKMVGADRLLTFDEIQKTDLTANFQTDCVDKTQPDNYQQMQRVPTKNNKFTLYFDPSSIQLAKYGTFFLYLFYIADTSSHVTSWHECSAQVYPHGAFFDRNERVHFTISQGNLVDDNFLDLPIHSIGKGEFLEITTKTVPAKVKLSESEGVELALHNLLSDMAISVDPVAQVSASNPDLWEALGEVKLSDGKVIRIGALDTTDVRLQIRPKKLPALLSTLATVKPDGIHDSLRVVLSYSSDFGGANRDNRAQISVRFEPSFFNLFVALLIGSLLGTSAGQLLPGTWKGWKAAGQKGGRGLLFSFIAELFALLLVALGSKFVLIQFDLDPWQFLPVLFIGFIVSGGKEVLSYIGLTQPKPAVANNPPGVSL